MPISLGRASPSFAFLLLFLSSLVVSRGSSFSRRRPRHPDFPKLTPEEYQKILTPPLPEDHADRPLRVIIDTDFDNEVDDHFALAWALLQQDNRTTSKDMNAISLEAVHIAPYDFQPRLKLILQAYDIYYIPPWNRTIEQKAFFAPFKRRIEAYVRLNITEEDLMANPHYNYDGKHRGGISGSYDSAIRMLTTMGVEDPKSLVFAGSESFMSGAYVPADSPAARNLVTAARLASPSDPLYVISIGCVTNIASALLLDPKIIRNIVVIWDAGYPTIINDVPNVALNLEEDLFASQLLFSSGVPLVYVPGYYVAQQLTLSLPDCISWIRGLPDLSIDRTHASPPPRNLLLGWHLYETYTHNPLFQLNAVDPDDLRGRTWIMWDVANVAWLLNPEVFAPSWMVTAPVLTDDLFWQKNPGGHLMREVTGVSPNGVWMAFSSQVNPVG